MITEITRDQALEVEKRHFKYGQELEKKDNIDFIRDFIKTNYKINSITDFICRLSEFDMTKELLMFKKDLQSKISDNDPNKVLLVYFAVKDSIRSKRLELLYEMRDEGVKECLKKYPHWRIKDTILNTKWKYMNKAFSPSNPVVDRGNNGNVEYKKHKRGLTCKWL